MLTKYNPTLSNLVFFIDALLVLIRELVFVTNVVVASLQLEMVYGNKLALYSPFFVHIVKLLMFGFPSNGLLDKSHCDNQLVSCTTTSAIQLLLITKFWGLFKTSLPVKRLYLASPIRPRYKACNVDGSDEISPVK